MFMGTRYISELCCVECGATFPLPRKKAQKRETNHIKDLYCYKCMRKTKHVENMKEA